ncbi:Dicer-like protein 2 [Didymella heteroderae]|uniref:Dicer-like protein 2 n=1 Tax=Didymella heteroderae TaxID=1769908 RepID=A0A9P5BW81_9PLEO|nr:Dicer-like protein 2 [Didymella heteroderae]
MKSFYHPTKARSGAVPHILGLSASPVLRSNLKELGAIEANLDSVCITPRHHRQDLFKHVHHPRLQRLAYIRCEARGTANASHVFEVLRKLSQRLLDRHGTPRSLLGLEAGFGRIGKPTRRDISTELSDQVRKFCNKAAHVHEELGPSAAAYFIPHTAEVIRNKAELAKASAFHVQKKDELVNQLRDAFDQEGITQAPDVMSLRIQLSLKVEQLIAFLECQEPETFSGLIFVQQRATVSVLRTILSSHPRTMSKFRCATFVGLSSSAHAKLVLSELFDEEAQKDTVPDFRAGKKDLVIATDALEEGIDVAVCNLVICFKTPPSLESYIQRRGRARMQASQYVIMVPNDSVQTQLNSWSELEDALINMYQDDDRERTRTAGSERGHELVDGWLYVETTGAYLTAEKAMAHLHHFCDIMPRQRYTETRPEFSFEESRSGSITCTVTLPNCVSSTL